MSISFVYLSVSCMLFQAICCWKGFAQNTRAEELYLHTLSGGDQQGNDNSTIEITVWQMHGEDNPDCISVTGNSSCKSLHYAYEEAMKNLSNTTTHLFIRIRDSNYKISSPLEINIFSNSLQYLEISAFFNKTIIVANSSKAVVKVACNATKQKSCILYSVYIKHIIFEKFESFYPSVMMLFTARFVAIVECTFRNNNCSAINSLDTPVTITGTNFIENHANEDFIHNSSMIFDAFPYFNRSNGGAIAFVFIFIAEITVKVENCHFLRNTASMKYQSPYINHSMNDTAFPRIGGGVVAVFMGNAKNNSVFLRNSQFLHNCAYSAAGIAVIMQSKSSLNNVYIDGCLFKRNSAQSTSGAILFSIWDYSYGNGIFITSSQFLDNTAKFAGGIKYMINNFEIKPENFKKHRLEIINSTFCGNNAESGYSMHLVDASISQQLMLEHVLIKNCTFCKHTSSDEQYIYLFNITSYYGGTILTHRINLQFIDDCYILNNRVGCGIFASNANIHIFGLLIIAGNRAEIPGAGMNLNDMSRIILHPGSHLKFIDNFSSEKGGAISVTTVGMPGLIYVHNPFCFLQYSDANLPPSQWNTKLEFINNGAEFKAGAIFINTLTACLWCEEPPYSSFEKALRWNNKFIYRQNYVSSMFSNILEKSENNHTPWVDISTDTSELVFHHPRQIEASPGESFEVQLAAKDELGKQIHSVTSATSICRHRNGSLSTNHMIMSDRYYVLAPFDMNMNISLSYKIDHRYYESLVKHHNLSHEIQFTDTYSSFVTSASLEVRPIACRPGFRYDVQLKSCVCNTGIQHVKRCFKSTVILEPGFWATNDSNGNLFAISCPVGFCKCNNPEDKLPGCSYDYKNPNKQCVHGRHGTLCGSCRSGYGLAMHSCKCVTCNHPTTAIILFVFLVIAVLVVACLIIYLNPSFSTKMRGPLFYAQILPYVYSSNGLFGEIVKGISSVAALGGPAGLPLEICLNKQFDNLDNNALTYVFAAVILLVLGIVYLLDHFYLLNFKRDTPFEAFWILLIGIYVFLSETSLMIFYCVPIPQKGLVFFYDGSLSCYKHKHLIMVIVSSVVSFLFVLLPPIIVVLICTGCCNVPLQVIDALTKGLRDPFRWWWAVSLIRRLAFVAIYVLVPNENFTRISFILLSTVILALHAQCRPYENNFANYSETMLLVSMSILATLQASNADDASKYIVSITLLYIFVLFVYLLINFIRRRRNAKKIKKQAFQSFENEQVKTQQGRRGKPPRILNNDSL